MKGRHEGVGATELQEGPQLRESRRRRHGQHVHGHGSCHRRGTPKMTATRDVVITVTNANDDGEVTLSSVQPKVGIDFHRHPLRPRRRREGCQVAVGTTISQIDRHAERTDGDHRRGRRHRRPSRTPIRQWLAALALTPTPGSIVSGRPPPTPTTMVPHPNSWKVSATMPW